MADYNIGDFLNHKEYGVGQVISVREGKIPELEIDFKGQGKQTLTEQLVTRSTSRLSPDGFHAFAYLEPDMTQLLLKEDPVEVVCRALEDFPGRRAKTEDLKDYLSPYLLDWKVWWEGTQPLLKESSRIDSTLSHVREYGLMQAELSPIQAAYQTFTRYRKYESFPKVYDQARRVLRELERGESLSDDEKEDLLGFFRKVITSEKYPVGERLDAFFRLVEGKWLSSEQIQSQLSELFKARFRIYDLDSYAQQRVVKYLISHQVDNQTLDLLATGMGAQEAAIKTLVDWAIHKSNSAVIARFLLAGLSENLPPDLKEDQYPDLKARLLACGDLVNCLPSRDPNWSSIFLTLRQTIQAIGNVGDLYTVKFLIPSLDMLAWKLQQRIPDLGMDETILLDSMVGPGLRIEYIIYLLDGVGYSKLPKMFFDLLFNRLLETVEIRGDQVLYPLLSRYWDSPQKQAAQLVEFVAKMPGPVTIEQAGNTLCDIARQAKEADLVALLPYLDHFHRLAGRWTWKIPLKALRENAYYELFLNPGGVIREGQYQDPALIDAVGKYVEYRLADIREENQSLRKRLEIYQVRLHESELQKKEQEAISRELRSHKTSDTPEGRFEERSRILKELVSTIAEFERFITNQAVRSKEIDAILRRLENIITTYNVITQEAIGSQVEFSPQKHRLVEGGVLSPGEVVVVVERGFLIRDPQDRLRLLKPALVKKA